MKKFLFTFVFMLVALSGYSQLVQSSSLVVTRKALDPVKRGWQQSIEASYQTQMSLTGGDMLGLNYIGGYRFNNALFLGFGVGLDFKINEALPKKVDNLILDINTVNIPLYIHLRAYFLKMRVSPFFALSVGGRLSTKHKFALELGDVKYNTCGLLLNPQLGINFRTSNKGNFYIAAGCGVHTMPTLDEVNNISISTKSKLQYGINVRAGFTF